MGVEAMDELRAVLRQPDQRTWRRHLSPTNWRRGLGRPAGGRPPAPWAGLPLGPLVPEAHEAHEGEAETRITGPPWFGAVVVVVIVAGGVVAGTALRPLPAAGPKPHHPTPTPPATTDAPPEPEPEPAAPEAVRVWPVPPVEVTGREVRREGVRWEIGAEGDLVALGDWDCDHVPTPAVLRPSTGALSVFDGWDEAPARVVATVGGASSLRSTNTCGEAVLSLADGGETVVDTRRPGP